MLARSLLRRWAARGRRLQIRKQDTLSILLHWSRDQQVYIGTVPDLVGVEGTGNTYEEALASVREAIRWWHQMRGEGSSSPVSQMLMEDTAEADAGEEPPQGC
jgi:predicted RNase H-like HicB family nuclease